MRTPRIAGLLLIASLAAAPSLIGCDKGPGDKVLNEQQKTTTTPNGGQTTTENKTVQHPDGSVTQEKHENSQHPTTPPNP